MKILQYTVQADEIAERVDTKYFDIKHVDLKLYKSFSITYKFESRFIKADESVPLPALSP
ncbi:CLUMA_CG000426, isoform A [Clunio marinus]|uniref:CLUMA_CG000426, isoform A n=1 Tax=Clunio marinus TaxID=568069 RepID=A0A1J1HJ97_9DIPT|nr:CLUMA_CG000426, isoform A [Clunio marinus]